MSMLIRLFAAMALCWIPAHAATIFYSDSGTFSPSTASSAFSGPSDTWAFSFQIDSNPAVSRVTAAGFDAAFSNFSYLLNGSPVVITPTDIRFFTTGALGGFDVCFTTFVILVGCPDGLGAEAGPQMFTGLTSAPTMLTGAFTSTEFDVFVSSTTYIQANNTIQAVVPEPSTLLTLAAGLLALGGLRRALKLVR